MIDLLSFLTQPPIIMIAALTLLLARIILHARQLKTAAKDPDLAKIMSTGVQNPLGIHRESLESAKNETVLHLASAQSALHDYAGDFKRSKRQKT